LGNSILPLTGAIDLNNYWDAWSRATRPQLIPDLVTAGREDEIPKIHQWLQSGPSVLELQADTQEEAISYFIASLFRLPVEEQEHVLSRTIVVEDVAAWHQWSHATVLSSLFRSSPIAVWSP